MLFRAIDVLASENDTVGFELPIPCGRFGTTDCKGVEGERFRPNGGPSAVT